MKKASLFASLMLLCLGTAWAANPSYLGKTPPTLTIGRFVGNPLPFKSLDDYKGEVVVVEFFATWCPPCRLAMPITTAIASKYRRPDLHILAVTREKSEIIERFFYHEETGVRVNYPVAVECTEDWKVVEIPQVYIIGRGGTVVCECNPRENYASELQAALAAPDPRLSEELTRKSQAAFDALLGENYAKVLAEAAKADGDDEKKPVLTYFQERVKSRYQRYGNLSDNWLEAGDGYMALAVLNGILPKFIGTDYEQAMRLRIAKITADCKDSLSLWKEYHLIADQARTGRKEDIATGFSKIVKFQKKMENVPKLLAAARNLAYVLTHPWDPNEAQN